MARVTRIFFKKAWEFVPCGVTLGVFAFLLNFFLAWHLISWEMGVFSGTMFGIASGLGSVFAYGFSNVLTVIIIDRRADVKEKTVKEERWQMKNYSRENNLSLLGEESYWAK